MTDYKEKFEKMKVAGNLAARTLDMLTENIKEGLELIYNKLNKTLANQGLKSMDSIEKEFDADIHEAITKIPAPKEKLKGKVIDVIEKGYTINEKVIRFAKVVVGE